MHVYAKRGICSFSNKEIRYSDTPRRPTQERFLLCTLPFLLRPFVLYHITPHHTVPYTTRHVAPAITGLWVGRGKLDRARRRDGNGRGPGVLSHGHRKELDDHRSRLRPAPRRIAQARGLGGEGQHGRLRSLAAGRIGVVGLDFSPTPVGVLV